MKFIRALSPKPASNVLRNSVDLGQTSLSSQQCPLLRWSSLLNYTPTHRRRVARWNRHTAHNLLFFSPTDLACSSSEPDEQIRGPLKPPAVTVKFAVLSAHPLPGEPVVLPSPRAITQTLKVQTAPECETAQNPSETTHSIPSARLADGRSA